MTGFQILTLVLLAGSLANLARALWAGGHLRAERRAPPLRRVPVAAPAPTAASAQRPAPPRADASKVSTAELPPVAAPVKTATGAAAKAETDEGAARDLFAGLERKPAEPDPAAEAARKASRLAELGFHHSIDTQAAQPVAPQTLPRTQTAELDDILKRIDKVLSENSAPGAAPAPTEPSAIPAAPAPAVSGQTAEATPKADAAKPELAKPEAPKPAWARPVTEDPPASDPGQQKLF